jgi:hypothetical protein
MAGPSGQIKKASPIREHDRKVTFHPSFRPE